MLLEICLSKLDQFLMETTEKKVLQLVLRAPISINLEMNDAEDKCKIQLEADLESK